MKEFQDMVSEFHQKAGAATHVKPTEPQVADIVLRYNLIYEELQEYRDAITVPVGTVNLVEVADAIGDLLYVVLGTAVTFGIDIEPIFREIHRSNMSKFIDGHRREDGKWIKGPSYSPANLEPIIQSQLGKQDV